MSVLVLVYFHIQELQTLQQEVQNYNYIELDPLMEPLILLLLKMISLVQLNLKEMMALVLPQQRELMQTSMVLQVQMICLVD